MRYHPSQTKSGTPFAGSSGNSQTSTPSTNRMRSGGIAELATSRACGSEQGQTSKLCFYTRINPCYPQAWEAFDFNEIMQFACNPDDRAARFRLQQILREVHFRT